MCNSLTETETRITLPLVAFNDSDKLANRVFNDLYEQRVRYIADLFKDDRHEQLHRVRKHF